MPQLGSGPSKWTSGSGYYTVQEYKDILKYANDRHIQVIPEFDMPGHAHAAIRAMLSRYRHSNDDTYLLVDLNDTSQYFSVQMFTDNAMNPCVKSTYAFVEKVMQEIIDIHQDIQPLNVFNFGGDEVATTAWGKSPACEALNLSHDDIKKHFVKEVSKIAKRNGLDLQAWEDGLMYHGHRNEPLGLADLETDKVYVNTWNNVWEWGSGSRSYILANAGYKVRTLKCKSKEKGARMIKI